MFTVHKSPIFIYPSSPQYPMPSFWRHVNSVLQESEIIIEGLDARMIDDTRHQEIERKVEKMGKKLLYVITKCDLLPIEEVKAASKKLQPSVFISSTEKFGTTILKKKILEISHGKPTIVGILGYPNVGKSSLINALSGRGSARTSSESGYTKGMQKIRVDSKILLIDTPGVFPNKEKDNSKHAKTGAIDYAKVKDPEVAALHLIKEERTTILRYYNIADGENEDLLERIGKKINKLGKGGHADLEATARFILREWQTGKMKR